MMRYVVLASHGRVGCCLAKGQPTSGSIWWLGILEASYKGKGVNSNDILREIQSNQTTD